MILLRTPVVPDSCPALTAEQRQFAATLHALLSEADTPGAARSWARGDHGPGLALWRALAEAGVTALAVPPSADGDGAGPLDVVVACEELGHHPVPGPVAETVAAVPVLLSSLRNDRVEGVADGVTTELTELVDAVVEGRLLATLCAPPALALAVDADVAGVAVLLDPDSGSVQLARPWPGQPAQRSVDPTRRLFRLEPTRLLAADAAAGPRTAAALELGTLAAAAQVLGAGRALLEIAVRYAAQRHQFGRPIGSFQAVQHQLADVLIGLEFARPLVHAAAHALACQSPTAPRDVSAAKVACSDAAERAARVALQVHGAIGYTLEHDLGLFLTKVRALLPLWGTRTAHRDRLLAALR
ncbi:MAG TPA: acyl-CoA dehydrogenase family protein [Kineosporiaceae bacterium]